MARLRQGQSEIIASGDIAGINRNGRGEFVNRTGNIAGTGQRGSQIFMRDRQPGIERHRGSVLLDGGGKLVGAQ